MCQKVWTDINFIPNEPCEFTAKCEQYNDGVPEGTEDTSKDDTCTICVYAYEYQPGPSPTGGRITGKPSKAWSNYNYGDQFVLPHSSVSLTASMTEPEDPPWEDKDKKWKEPMHEFVGYVYDTKQDLTGLWWHDNGGSGWFSDRTDENTTYYTSVITETESIEIQLQIRDDPTYAEDGDVDATGDPNSCDFTLYETHLERDQFNFKENYTSSNFYMYDPRTDKTISNTKEEGTTENSLNFNCHQSTSHAYNGSYEYNWDDNHPVNSENWDTCTSDSLEVGDVCTFILYQSVGHSSTYVGDNEIWGANNWIPGAPFIHPWYTVDLDEFLDERNYDSMVCYKNPNNEE